MEGRHCLWEMVSKGHFPLPTPHFPPAPGRCGGQAQGLNWSFNSWPSASTVQQSCSVSLPYLGAEMAPCSFGGVEREGILLLLPTPPTEAGHHGASYHPMPLPWADTRDPAPPAQTHWISSACLDSPVQSGLFPPNLPWPWAHHHHRPSPTQGHPHGRLAREGYQASCTVKACPVTSLPPPSPSLSLQMPSSQETSFFRSVLPVHRPRWAPWPSRWLIRAWCSPIKTGCGSTESEPQGSQAWEDKAPSSSPLGSHWAFVSVEPPVAQPPASLPTVLLGWGTFTPWEGCPDLLPTSWTSHSHPHTHPLQWPGITRGPSY